MKKKNKQKFELKKIKKLPAICFVSFFGLCLEPFLPAMKPALALLIRGILILPSLITLCLWRKAMESSTVFLGILPLIVFAFLPIFSSERVFLMVWLLLFLFLVGCTAWPFVRCPKKKDALFQVFLLIPIDFLMLLYCFRMDCGTYIGDGDLTLFLVSLILGMLLSALLLIKWLWKRLKWGMRITVFLSFAFAIASVLFFLGMNVNYAFDFDDPIPYTAVIEKKRYDGGGRYSRGHHEFWMTVNGKEIELEVSRSQYNTYEEGDVYTFHYYEGALGLPFYISED